MGNLVASIRDLVETPLTQPLDPVHLWLIVGIVIVSVGFWYLILDHLHTALPVE
jgi:hypothetical protein